jgi:hypothetical protein
MARTILPKSLPEEPAIKLEVSQVTSLCVFAAVGLAIWFVVPRDWWYLVAMIAAGFAAGMTNPQRPSTPALGMVGAQLAAFVVEYTGLERKPSYGPLPGVVQFAFLYGIVLFMAWVGQWLGPKIRWRRAIPVLVAPLVFVLLPTPASAHTYYYEHAFSVGYPVQYESDGAMRQITILYDYNYQQLGGVSMWHHCGNRLTS